MKAVVAAFNQEKALVGAFSVITNLRMDLRFKLYYSVVNFVPGDHGTMSIQEYDIRTRYVSVM